MCLIFIDTFRYLLTQAWEIVRDNTYLVLGICVFLYIAYKLQHIINLLVLIAKILDGQEKKLIDIGEKIDMAASEITRNQNP